MLDQALDGGKAGVARNEDEQAVVALDEELVAARLELDMRRSN